MKIPLRIGLVLSALVFLGMFESFSAEAKTEDSQPICVPYDLSPLPNPSSLEGYWCFYGTTVFDKTNPKVRKADFYYSSADSKEWIVVQEFWGRVRVYTHSQHSKFTAYGLETPNGAWIKDGYLEKLEEERNSDGGVARIRVVFGGKEYWYDVAP